jgi:hypothetical protein
MSLYYSGNFHLYGTSCHSQFKVTVVKSNVNSLDEVKDYIEQTLKDGPYKSCNAIDYDSRTK